MQEIEEDSRLSRSLKPFTDTASTADICKILLLLHLCCTADRVGMIRGLVRKHMEDPEFKAILLVEIIARVIKNNIHLKLRTKMQKLKKPLEEPYRFLKKKEGFLSHSAF